MLVGLRRHFLTPRTFPFTPTTRNFTTSPTATMPVTYNVTLKPDASHEKLEEAKKEVTDKGGKITHEFSLIKGFTAELPDDLVSTFETNDHVTVEKDAEVRTQ